MLTRIVKMHFNPSFVEEFKTLFDSVKPLILNFEGCVAIKLLQHETNSALFFTVSNWESAMYLENYRQSELFMQTWSKVKPNFSAKAEAWSLLAI